MIYTDTIIRETMKERRKMTNEEAIKIIEDKTSINEPLELYEALKLAIEALEKQIPNKPNYVRQFADKSIGLCSCNYAVDSTMRYCKNCGQRIDWSE